MIFPKGIIKRFNETAGIGPGPGAYNPKFFTDIGEGKKQYGPGHGNSTRVCIGKRGSFVNESTPSYLSTKHLKTLDVHHKTLCSAKMSQIKDGPNYALTPRSQLDCTPFRSKRRLESGHWNSSRVCIGKKESFVNESTPSYLSTKHLQTLDVHHKTLCSAKMSQIKDGAPRILKRLEQSDITKENIPPEELDPVTTISPRTQPTISKFLMSTRNGRGTVTDTRMCKKCPICRKGFSTSYQLNRHFGVHSEKKQKCDRCKYRSSRPDHLQLHKMRIHQDQKYYSCRSCKLKFESVRKLKQHKSTHPVIKHGCSVCQKVFSTKYKLHRHSLTHYRLNAKQRD